MYYNRKASGRPFKTDKQWFRFQTRYLLGENYPQYPFGYGLSYSKFIYENFKLDRETMRRGERVVASVELTNTSDRDGVEIVQLYIKDCVADVVRPMRELKDFARVELKAGEKKRVCFEITEEKLAYYHEDRSFGADKGVFEVFIGADSNASDKQTFSLVD